MFELTEEYHHSTDFGKNFDTCCESKQRDGWLAIALREIVYHRIFHFFGCGVRSSGLALTARPLLIIVTNESVYRIDAHFSHFVTHRYDLGISAVSVSTFSRSYWIVMGLSAICS